MTIGFYRNDNNVSALRITDLKRSLCVMSDSLEPNGMAFSTSSFTQKETLVTTVLQRDKHCSPKNAQNLFVVVGLNIEYLRYQLSLCQQRTNKDFVIPWIPNTTVFRKSGGSRFVPPFPHVSSIRMVDLVAHIPSFDHCYRQSTGLWPGRRRAMRECRDLNISMRLKGIIWIVKDAVDGCWRGQGRLL